MKSVEKWISLEKEVKDWGFLWPNAETILDQILSECQEIREALVSKEDQAPLQNEIGDLIQAALSLCIFCEFDVEETLSKSTAKFERRFEALKQLIGKSDLPTAQGQSVERLLTFWKKAKEQVG